MVQEIHRYHSMGAGASSTKSGTQTAEPAINRKTVLQIAQKSKDASLACLIQELEAQVRDLHSQAAEDAARIRTLEAQVLELKSPEFSEKRHSVIPNEGISDSINAADLERAAAAAMNRMDTVFMREVFGRHASGVWMLKSKLIPALREVEAPVLQMSSGHHSSDFASLENDIFRRVDADANGLVDFSEFMQAAQLPDDLEMLLEEDHLSMIAPALRACIASSDNQVASFANVSEEALCGAVDSSINSIKMRLLQTHRKVVSAMHAKAKVQEEINNEPSKKFSIRQMSTGSIDDFHEGLHNRIGSPNPDFLKAMRSEHLTKGGHDYLFVSSNYKLKTQASLEWLYVAGDDSGVRLELPVTDSGHGRIIQSIDNLLKKPLVKAAKLTREEMIAIVMYTGPAFVLYNTVLRQFPADIYEVFKAANNLFSTTIFVLVSAINKLSRCAKIPTGTLLYRGLGGTLEFPERFTRPDPNCKTPNALGFLEYGFMSTTADKSIAVQYSGVEEGRPRAAILQIRPNSVDRGADISEFSQYPAEKEYLFVPYSFVQGEGRQRTEVTEGGGVLTVVPVRVNINLKTETVDELKEKKKRLHLASAGAVVEEVRYELERWAQSPEATARLRRDSKRDVIHFTAATFAAKIVEQCNSVVERHRETTAEEYVDDGVFRRLVSELLDMKAWANEKKELFMRDDSQLLRHLHDESLRNCHRLWESFLRKFMTGSLISLIGGEPASLRLLRSRGLVMRSVLSADKNSDGEPILVQAGADGWTATDICAAAAAGADVLALDSINSNAVYQAAQYGHLDSMTALITAGCDVNCISIGGLSPIWIAAFYGHASCIQLLVSCKGDANQCNDDGVSPIHIAAANGHALCIRELVSLGGDANKCKDDGMSPILAAARAGFAPCIKELVSFGCDVNKCSDDGYSPIFVAAQCGHSLCIKELVSCGGDVNKCTNDGVSPILVAAHNGHAFCIQLLASSGGDVNKCSNDGVSPIYYAAQQGDAVCVSQLLKSGADPLSSWNGNSALDAARGSGNEECVRELEVALQ